MRRVTFAECERAVMDHFGISKTALLSDSRKRDIAFPRMIVMALARELTMLTTTAIGRRLNRDHSTVVVGISRVAKLCESDPAFAADVAAIRRRLVNPSPDNYVPAVETWVANYTPPAPKLVKPIKIKPMKHRFL